MPPSGVRKWKIVAGGGHAPTAATPTGKFRAKLCARSPRRVRGFALNFVEGESKGGNSRVRHRRARLLPHFEARQRALIVR